MSFKYRDRISRVLLNTASSGVIPMWAARLRLAVGCSGVAAAATVEAGTVLSGLISSESAAAQFRPRLSNVLSSVIFNIFVYPPIIQIKLIARLEPGHIPCSVWGAVYELDGCRINVWSGYRGCLLRAPGCLGLRRSSYGQELRGAWFMALVARLNLD